MRLSTKGRYAVTAMMELVIQVGDAPVTLADISRRQGVSVSYLEQLFARLRRQGLVSGVRGPGGGYRLARPPATISVAEVIVAVDEEASAEVLADALWQALSVQIYDFLDGISLAQLAERGAEVRDLGSSNFPAPSPGNGLE